MGIFINFLKKESAAGKLSTAYNYQRSSSNIRQIADKKIQNTVDDSHLHKLR